MNKWMKALAILTILGIFFVLSLIFLKIVAQIWLLDLFFDAFTTFADITGINKYLIQVLMAIFFVPFFFGASNVISADKKKRRIGIFILVSLFIIYNFGLFFLSKDLFFDKDGRATKYYALTPEGIVYSDQPGVDRVYGIEFKPVTPGIIKNLKLLEKGDFTPIDPNRTQFFNPITGEPKLWYYQHPDKSFDFFDKPGYHPITGEPLLPATKEIYLSWKEYSELAKDKKVNKTENVEGPSKKDNVNVKEDLRKVDRFKELDEFKLTMNSLHLNKATQNIGLVIPTTDSKFRSIEKGFSNQLKVDNFNIVNNYFNDSFFSKGYFDKIYSGDSNLLLSGEIFSQLNYLILGQFNYSFRKSKTMNEDLISCDINFTYKLINNTNIVSSDNISAIGPGFTEELALKRGIEIIANKFSLILKGKL